MVDFVQAYYDWLYSSQGYGFGEYQIGSVPFLQLTDIDECPPEYLKHFTFSYAPGFPDSLFEFDPETETYNDDIDFVRNFVKGVRDNFYQKKGTESSYEYFFRTLYGVEQFEGNWIEYPKKYILRLNAGRPYGFDSVQDVSGSPVWEAGFGWKDAEGNIGEGIDYDELSHLQYSVLNVHVIQDSYWYQDFSYLVKTEDTEESGEPTYIETIEELLHPAGLQGFYEVTLEDYVPPEGYDEEFGICEEPMLGNYFPYRLNSTSGFTGCVGCSGSPFAFDGVGYDHATDDVLSGFSGATFNMPTYHFPNWAEGISCSLEPNKFDEHCTGVPDFGSIYIGDFIYLCDADQSPNLGRTGCTGPRPGEVTNDCNAGQCWNC